MKLLLALAVLAAAGLVLLDRERADVPLLDRDDDPATEQRDRGRDRARSEPELRPARCPEGVAGCRSVTGRIVLVESVDPDGDGDLHVVLAAGSISLPGATAVDVAPALRPRRDPRIGQRATAAGPVQTGSYGQSQIHALRFRVQR
jgi:hypothetical protein